MPARKVSGALAALTLLVAGGCAPSAPSPPAAATAPAPAPPATAAARPDKEWGGGRWDRQPQPGDAPDIGQLRADGLPLTPAWRKKSDALDRARASGAELHGNDSLCIPSGMPFMMIANSLEFLYSPGRIGIIAGTRGLQIRNIWIDGRAHTQDQYLLDSFSGESIGHWEGETLVVDTIGLRSGNELVYGLKGTALHVVERFHQSGPDQLQIDTRVTDPRALASPWTYSTVYLRHRDQVIGESYCVSSLDRSVDPRTGKEGFNLTPPPQEGVGVPQADGTH